MQKMRGMHILIGIDDTDNKDSRGTGYKSRQLAALIESEALGKVKGITRHQLFVHDSIAYTSQNSSACIEVLSNDLDRIKNLCSEFIIRESAEGSDAGLCIAEWGKVSDNVIHWGQRAKKVVLKLEDAIKLAGDEGIYLKGFTGTRIGQIGALAAVGLRKSGDDGRFIWLEGTKELREFEPGIYQAEELKNILNIDRIISHEEGDVKNEDNLYCGEWTRPVLKNGEATLLVKKVKTNKNYGWETVSKEYIRAHS